MPSQDVPGQDVPGQDVPGQDVPGQDVPGRDVAQSFPVLIETPDGVQINVNGVAQVTLPCHTRFTERGRKEEELSAERLDFWLPQGSNLLIGTMGMIILAALFTMVGIGIQLGVAGVLAVGLSEASTFGRWVSFLILCAVGVFTLRYSVTAIRALADPQPGSSMSNTAGTSFTL
jgi:hypothetical protein